MGAAVGATGTAGAGAGVPGAGSGLADLQAVVGTSATRTERTRQQGCRGREKVAPIGRAREAGSRSGRVGAGIQRNRGGAEDTEFRGEGKEGRNDTAKGSPPLCSVFSAPPRLPSSSAPESGRAGKRQADRASAPQLEHAALLHPQADVAHVLRVLQRIRAEDEEARLAAGLEPPDPALGEDRERRGLAPGAKALGRLERAEALQGEEL